MRKAVVGALAGAVLVLVSGSPADAAPKKGPGFGSNAIVRLSTDELVIRVTACPNDPPSSFTTQVDQDGDGTTDANGFLSYTCTGDEKNQRITIPLDGTLTEGSTADVDLQFNGDSGEWTASFDNVKVKA